MLFLDLPADIIIKIANNLNLHDSVSLISTCRRLREMIQNDDCFYWQIVHPSLLNSFPKNISAARTEETESILDTTEMLKSENKSKVIVRTPGVSINHLKRKFLADPSDKREEKSARAYTSMQSVNDDRVSVWKDTLETYQMEENTVEILKSLETNVFSQLTSLTISLDNYFGCEPISPSTNKIQCIKNAPSLNHLEIDHSVLTIANLEEIHQNNLKLTTLAFISSGIVVPDSYTLPEKLEPARNLTTLILDKNSNIWDRNCTSMNYIIVKYPHLIHLEYLITVSPNHYMEYAMPLNGIFPETKFNTCSNYNNRGYNPKDYYKKSGDQFLSTLPKTLKVLKINANIFKNPIYSLKESGVQLNTLAVYAYDSPSSNYGADLFDNAERIQYLKDSTFLKSLTCSVGMELEAFDNHMISTTITHLNIGEDRFASIKKLDLVKVLTAYPSLQEFTILDRKCTITATVSTDSTVKYPSLRLLRIDGPQTAEALRFIRISLPNLKVLERVFYAYLHEVYLKAHVQKPIRHGCVYHEWRDPVRTNNIKRFTIDLTGLDLAVLHLKTSFSVFSEDYEHKLYVKIQSKNLYTAYSAVITHYGFRDVKESNTFVGAYDTNVPNRITIQGGSIGSLKINDYIFYQ